MDRKNRKRQTNSVHKHGSSNTYFSASRDHGLNRKSQRLLRPAPIQQNTTTNNHLLIWHAALGQEIWFIITSRVWAKYCSINFLHIFPSLMIICNCKITFQHSSATSTMWYSGSPVHDKGKRKGMDQTILKSYFLLLLNTCSSSALL